MLLRKYTFLLIINVFSLISIKSVTIKTPSEPQQIERCNVSRAYIKILMYASLKENDKKKILGKFRSVDIDSDYVNSLYNKIYSNEGDLEFNSEPVCLGELNRIQTLLVLAAFLDDYPSYDEEILSAIESANFNIREILSNEIKNNPHLQDSNGTTLLMLVTDKALQSVPDPFYPISLVKLLLELGANPNILSKVQYSTGFVGTNGVNINFTPLMIATKYKNPEIIKLLIEYGADIEIKNINGSTAIDIARSAHYHNEVIEVLLVDSLKEQKSQRNLYISLISILAQCCVD